MSFAASPLSGFISHFGLTGDPSSQLLMAV